MKLRIRSLASGGVVVLALLTGGVLGCRKSRSEVPQRAKIAGTNIQRFAVKGVVRELRADGTTVVISHEEIPNFMSAMTMPFRARQSNELAQLRAGDEVTFRLSVGDEESWIDQVRKTGRRFATGPERVGAAGTNGVPAGVNVVEALSTYALTNELGRPVRFTDYRGQAIGLTFFFTRCPVPEYCPRLTKNFKAASTKLAAMANAPTNWHLFSISFDPEVDTPVVLRSYGMAYGYDSNRWSFLTASPGDIQEMTARFGVSTQKSPAGFDHNFLTVVLDAAGFMQAGWPIGGDTADQLVAEIINAASSTNRGAGNP